MHACLKYFSYFLFLIASISCYAQNKTLDSLKYLVKQAKNDTNKVNLINSMVWKMKSIGNYTEALKYTFEAEKLGKDLKYDVGLVGVYCNLGLVYLYQGNYPLSLESQQKSLTYAEKIKSKKAMANALSNIGNLYWQQEILDKALYYQQMALKLRQEYLPNGQQVGSKRDIANSLGNIGIIYDNMGKIDTALYYHMKSLPLMQASGNKEGEANTLNNIGNAYQVKNDFKMALDYYNQALNLYSQIGNKSGMSTSYYNIGGIYFEMNDFKSTEENHLRSLSIANDIGDLDARKDAYYGLYTLYEKTGKDQKALDYYLSYVRTKDSLVNEESTKKTIRLEMNFEFEKKAAAEKIEQEKRDALAAEEFKKQQIIIWSSCFVLILVIVFAIIIYRSYLQKGKANIEIKNQKQIIEIKQKEIIDSIYYAKRIQTALITSEQYIERTINKLSGDTKET